MKTINDFNRIPGLKLAVFYSMLSIPKNALMLFLTLILIASCDSASTFQRHPVEELNESNSVTPIEETSSKTENPVEIPYSDQNTETITDSTAITPAESSNSNEHIDWDFFSQESENTYDVTTSSLNPSQKTTPEIPEESGSSERPELETETKPEHHPVALNLFGPSDFEPEYGIGLWNDFNHFHLGQHFIDKKTDGNHVMVFTTPIPSQQQAVQPLGFASYNDFLESCLKNVSHFRCRKSEINYHARSQGYQNAPDNIGLSGTSFWYTYTFKLNRFFNEKECSKKGCYSFLSQFHGQNLAPISAVLLSRNRDHPTKMDLSFTTKAWCDSEASKIQELCSGKTHQVCQKNGECRPYKNIVYGVVKGLIPGQEYRVLMKIHWGTEDRGALQAYFKAIGEKYTTIVDEQNIPTSADDEDRHVLQMGLYWSNLIDLQALINNGENPDIGPVRVEIDDIWATETHCDLPDAAQISNLQADC